MTAFESTISLNKTARTAGVLILVTAVFAIFSMQYVPSTLILPGDAAATANNIMASEGLFRLAIASDVVIFLIEIALVVLFYELLRPVNTTLSLVAAAARLGMAIIQGINLLYKFAALLLLSGAGYLTVFQPDQLHALALLFLNAYDFVVYIWGLFFGLHLLVLGYLVYKSGYIPRILGVLLLIIALNYLAQSFGAILLPQYKTIFGMLTVIGYFEIVWPLWLVIKGVKDQSPGAAENS